MTIAPSSTSAERETLPSLPVATLGELLSYAASRYADAVALTAEGRDYTFRQLDRMAAQFAHALKARGVRKQDRVSLYGSNSAQWIIAYHGILRLGAVVNPVNVMLTTDEMAYVLKDCGSVALVADAEKLIPMAANGLSDALKVVVSLGATGPSGATAFNEFIHAAPETFEPAVVEPAAMSTLCYTSGTTGHPKGAMQSHHSVVFNAAMTAHMHGRRRGDVIVSALPCPHVYGNVVMNSALMYGLTLVLHSRFDEQAILHSIARYRATILEGVPAMYLLLLNHPALERADLSSLRFCTVGGQTMPVTKMEAVRARFRCPLVELWGMTELAGLGTTFPADASPRLGSIGLPLPGVEAKIVDAEDACRELDAEQPGELMIRGPIVMMSYFGNDAATRETLEPDGWLHTGDIARRDHDGFIYIVDRKKDMILTAGFNIYPAELERVIAMHPEVAMVAVGAVPDDVKGEVPKAYIVLRRGGRASAEDILLHCREHLAAYKIPRQVQFVSELPKTSTGKVMRRALRSLDTAT